MGIVQSSYNSSNVGAPTFLLLFLSQNFVGVMNIKVKVKIWGLPLILILSHPSCRVLLGYFQTKQGPFACVRLDVRKLMDLDPISSFQKLSRCYLWQEGLPPSLPPPLKVAPSSPSSLHINALGVRARPSSHVSRLCRCVRFDRAPTDIHLNVRFFEVIFHVLLAVFLSSSSCLRKKE